MPATHHKSAAVAINIAGHECEMQVQIAYVVEPACKGAHDEPACDESIEILSIRKVLHSDLGADIMPILPSAMVDKLAAEIAEELVAA